MNQTESKFVRTFGTNMILVGVLSILSVIMLYLAGSYFLAALYTSQILNAIGLISGQHVFFGALAAIPGIVFIILGVIANKFDKLWPHIVGLVIYSADTLLMLWDAIVSGQPEAFIMDILFHALFIFWIASSMRTFIKYKNMPKEPQVEYVVADAEKVEAVAEAEESNETTAE